MEKLPFNRDKLAQVFDENPEILRVIEKCFSDGNFIKLFLPLLMVLNPKEAVLLSFLKYWANKRRKDQDGFGWFYCTSNTIKKYLRFSRSAQDRSFAILRQKEFIKTKFKTGTSPPVRLIWIKWDTIAIELVKFEYEFPSELKNSKQIKNSRMLSEIQEMESEDD